MNQHTNLRDELLALAKANNFSAPDIAELTEYSISSVEAWLMPDRDSPRSRPVPERALSLMKLKIDKTLAELQAQADSSL